MFKYIFDLIIVLKCNVCQRTFKHRSNLKIHLKLHLQHSEDEYICAECNRSYKYKKNLVYHIRKCHRSDMPLPKIKCTYQDCDRAFSKRVSLEVNFKIDLFKSNFFCSKIYCIT